MNNKMQVSSWYIFLHEGFVQKTFKKAIISAVPKKDAVDNPYVSPTGIISVR